MAERVERVDEGVGNGRKVDAEGKRSRFSLELVMAELEGLVL